MTKAIPMIPKDDPEHPKMQAIIDSGWLLTSTALWQHEHFSRSEINYAKGAICKTLQGKADQKVAFIQFAERILLASRMFHADPANWIDLPSLWFHPEYSEGFSSTAQLLRQVEIRRQEIPGYQEGIRLFADAYWQYIKLPTTITIRRCYKKLLKLKEYGLLQLWNSVIILSQIH